jgi:AraC-like DNA-binding protein
VKLDPEPLGDGAFHAEANVRELSGLGIGSWACSNLKIARPRELLDGTDDLVLTIITSGTVRASQRGHDIELGPGQAVLQSSAEAGDMTIPVSPSRFVGLRLPRKALASLVHDPEDMLIRPLPANTEAMRLLALYIRELDAGYQLATPDLAGIVVDHLIDLGALIIGANRDGAAVAEDRGLAAARLTAIKADISDNLDDGDLTLPAVAARLRLTPRYIQRLFESAGSTFSEFVLDQRLTRAHRLLTDPRRRSSTIGTIAFESGFGDLSYFNRTFRRQYGATPSDIRAVPRRSA